MQQESLFSSQLHKYLSMAMKIWPSLRVGIRHISDITGPHDQSMLPHRPYNTMTEELFLRTITDDMHLFIMEHDVKQQDLQDYMNEILDLLNIDEDLSLSNNKMGSVRYMSIEILKVMIELQDGKTKSVDDFENNIYNVVLQMGIGEALQQGGDESSEDDDEEMEEEKGGYQSEDEEFDEDEEMQEGQENKDKENKNKQKTEQELQKEKQLEDDGWVVVRKK